MGLLRSSQNSFKKKCIGLGRMLKNGWHNLMRNKILAVATLLIITLMFFVFNLVLALSYASESVLQSVGQKVDIRVEILPGVEHYSVQTLINRLKKSPDVSDVIYVSKEEALRNFGEKYPNVISFLDRNSLQNPLPDVVRIVGKDVAANKRIITLLEDKEFSRIVDQKKLENDVEQKNRNEKILNITQFIRGIGFWLNLIFAVVAVLIILNSINLSIHSHRHEINIMRLVGANTGYIRGGFLFEGVMYAIFALILSTVLSQLTLLYLSKNLIGIITNESLLVGLDAILLHFEDNFWFTFGWQLAGVILVGLVSSFLAIELYLRKRFSF